MLEVRSKLKGKEDQIMKLETELEKLRELNSSNLFQQYTVISEENATLTKERNILEYKFEELSLAHEKLMNNFQTEKEDNLRIKDENKLIKMDIQKL